MSQDGSSGGGEDEPELNITTLSVIYSASATGVLILEALVVRLLRRGRRKQIGDGLMALNEWSLLTKTCVVYFLAVFGLLPALLFWTSLLSGWILGAIEGWSTSLAFEYVLGNMIGIGPLVYLTPVNTMGIIFDILISCWTMIISATVVGLSAALSLSLQWLESLHPTVWGMFRALFIYVPLMMMAVAAASGASLAWLEEWAFVDGFLFMVGFLCGIQDPLTPMAPASDEGNFLVALCSVLELLLGGAVIGVIGSHPAVTKFIIFLEGRNEETSETNGIEEEPTKSTDVTASDDKEVVGAQG